MIVFFLPRVSRFYWNLGFHFTIVISRISAPGLVKDLIFRSGINFRSLFFGAFILKSHFDGDLMLQLPLPLIYWV